MRRTCLNLTAGTEHYIHTQLRLRAPRHPLHPTVNACSHTQSHMWTCTPTSKQARLLNNVMNRSAEPLKFSGTPDHQTLERQTLCRTCDEAENLYQIPQTDHRGIQNMFDVSASCETDPTSKSALSFCSWWRIRHCMEERNGKNHVANDEDLFFVARGILRVPIHIQNLHCTAGLFHLTTIAV